jgi:hypothetical protein
VHRARRLPTPLGLLRDLVITEDTATNGIGSFQDAQLTATKSVMMRYLGMQTDLALADMAAPRFVMAAPVSP